jgi:HEPN superfamily protein
MVSNPAHPATAPRPAGQRPTGQRPPGLMPQGPMPPGSRQTSLTSSDARPPGLMPPGPRPPVSVREVAPLAHAPTAATQETPTIPANLLPSRTPAQLLAIAHQGLAEAARTSPDGLRYAAAHLAALRAAAAVLAARARPAAPTRRSRVTSAWSLLVLVAPEFSDWASYFSLAAVKRAAAEAGIPRVVTAGEADDLLRSAEHFVSLVEATLGVAYQPTLEAA